MDCPLHRTMHGVNDSNRIFWKSIRHASQWINKHDCSVHIHIIAFAAATINHLQDSSIDVEDGLSEIAVYDASRYNYEQKLTSGGWRVCRLEKYPICWFRTSMTEVHASIRLNEAYNVRYVCSFSLVPGNKGMLKFTGFLDPRSLNREKTECWSDKGAQLGDDGPNNRNCMNKIHQLS